MFRPFPADLITHAAQGQEGRHRPRAHRPAPRRRRARSSRRSARPWRKGLENANATGEPPAPRRRRLRQARDPRLLLRLLRPRHPRPPAEPPHRGRRQHAARRKATPAVLPRHRLHPEGHTAAEAPDLAGEAARGLSRTSRTWRWTRAEHINLMPKGATSIRIHSVGGWGAITMGKNLAQTAADLLGPLHQGQPEVRLREEGAAHDLLRHTRTRARSPELRAQAA